MTRKQIDMATYYYLLFCFHCSENSGADTTSDWYKVFIYTSDISMVQEETMAEKYNLNY